MTSRIISRVLSLVRGCRSTLRGRNKLQDQQAPDFIREMQFNAVEEKQADWVHWGDRADVFSNWTNHSNR